MAIVMTLLAVAAALLAANAYAKAASFFSALLAVQPDALEPFQPGPGLPSSGPIAPAKFRYLNAKQFSSLQDPELRRLGALAYSALSAYAVSFGALLVAALVWAAGRGA